MTGPANQEQPQPLGWWVRNNTPRPIWLEQHGRILTLAPLEERRWSDQSDPRDAFPDLRRLEDRRQVAIGHQLADPGRDEALATAGHVTLVTGFGWLVSFWPLSLWWWLRIGGILGIGLALGFLLLRIRPSRRATGRRARRRTWYNATMLVVVLVGLLMPTTVVYFATDLHTVVSVWPDGFRIDMESPLVLIGRFMQLTFIAIATLLPALMYFQFDAERLGILRDRWIQNVFRLDPALATTEDVYAKYGKQLDEAYGEVDDGKGRLTRGRRSPIILATLVLAFGWLLILLKAGDPIKGDPALSFVTLLDPQQSTVSFAFLGAYFFALQLVWQGYVRADLRPKTYTTIAVRVLVVVIVAWLIDATTDAGGTPEALYLLAFTAGFVPDRVLHLLWEKVLPGLNKLLDQGGQQPLTELEGIDLYERTRLSEEGITSVEALANHDLLDLFFKTRIPAARLVDWMDQAILVMYLGADEPSTEAAADGPKLRCALRELGIRTASDLVQLTRLDHRTGHLSRGKVDELTGALHSIVPAQKRATIRCRLTVLVATLDHSEWLGRIEHWRRSDLIERRPSDRLYIDGQGRLRPGDPRFDEQGPGRPPPAAIRWTSNGAIGAPDGVTRAPAS
ncbi:hypothetical protein [Paractinoplanes maris]|uniref:hypothetical protein n=1 Tax=Paractinoplanes maris TaxID=1734446 RepID=UPI0020210682|nr:hypothetical protein [Actinoplanes maris]